MPYTDRLQNAYAGKAIAALFGNKENEQAMDELIATQTYKPIVTPEQRYKGNYFKGLSGLSANEREAWSKNYLKELLGLDDSLKDNFYKNQLFTDYFKNSEKPEDLEIWANRKNITKRQRDILYAQKAIEENLDGISDLKETPFSPFAAITDPSNSYASNIITAKGQETLRDEAENFLTALSQQAVSEYKLLLQLLDTDTKLNLLQSFHDISSEVSPYYKEYRGTNKLPITELEEEELLAHFNAWQDIGGNAFAIRKMQKYYQDTVANHQSFAEKATNTAVQFKDSAAGMIVRGAGMAAGLMGVDREEGEGYWENVIDNEITRYGDRITTTNSYNPEEQKRLEELGLSDNPIINTSDQQNKLLSANTPFELLGQYGFTTASTLLSFGGSALVSGAIKGTGALAKATMVGKGLNATAKGTQLAKRLIQAKDIGNFLVVGGVASIEGGMNAAQTRQSSLDAFNADIDKKWGEVINKDIEDVVRSNPQEAMNLLKQKGYQLPEGALINEANIKMMTEALQQEPDIVEAFSEKYKDSIAAERERAQEDATSAMYVNFVGNSIINGFINSTLKSTLHAPSVLRTLRRHNLVGSPLKRQGINVTGNASKGWKATVNKYTKRQAFKNRLKESWGEGLEEYSQDLSGGFAEGFAADKRQQYIDFKYGEEEGNNAFELDVAQSMAAGLATMGETAVSKEAIKAGLYGAMSTFLGGVNVNSNILSGNRGPASKLDGESNWAYAKRQSPIEWRSGITPLFSGKQTAAINEQREKMAKNVNDFFADKEAQNLFFNIGASTNWIVKALEAAKRGDEKAVRDAKLGELMANLATLNSLEGTAFHEAALTSLQANANFDVKNLDNPESLESKAVEQYKNAIPNRTDNTSDVEILNRIKKSASDLLEMNDRIKKETKEVEKLFGEETDKDVKEAIVFERLSIQDDKKRIKQLDEEINKVKSAVAEESSTIEDSGLNQSARRTVARFGSLGRATKELEKLKKQREDSDKLLTDIDKALKEGIESTEEESQLRGMRSILAEEINFYDRLIKESNQAINDFTVSAKVTTETTTDDKGNKVTTSVTEGTQTLSANDIMNLEARDRAYMLNPKNRDLYSQEQQAEIDKVRSIGTALHQDFESKVLDRGSLETSYQKSMRALLSLMENPNRFNAYVRKVKENKERTLLEKKYAYLNDYTDENYAEFAQELDRINNSADQREQRAAASVLNKSKNKLLDKYKAERTRLKEIYDVLPKNDVFSKLTDNQKGLFIHALDYLSSKEIPFGDKEAIVSALTQTDESDTYTFEKYVNTVNAELGENDKVTFSELGEVVQLFNDVMDEHYKVKKEKEVNTRPVEVTPTETKDNNPAGPGVFSEGATSSPNEEATAQGTTTSSPLAEAFRNNSNNKVAEAVELAIKIIANTSNKSANKAAKKLATDTLLELSDKEFENEEELASSLIQKANGLTIESDETSSLQAASLLKQIAARIQTKVQKDKKLSINSTSTPTTPSVPTTGTATTTAYRGIRKGTNHSPNSSGMESLNIAEMLERFPNGHIAKYLERYKVDEFLSNPDNLSRDTPIMFITDPQLAEEIKASIEELGREYDITSIPLVPVVEVSSGGITITQDGVEKHYQPIGIMPATYRSDLSGAYRLGKIRELAQKQNPGELIKDDAGNVINTRLTEAVNATPARHLKQGVEENKSAQTLGISDLSPAEQKQLEGLNKKERRKSPIYLRIKRDFINRLAVKRNTSGRHLSYEVDNLKGDGEGFGVFITPLSRTYDKNSDTLISELFQSNQIDEALKSNSRIKRFADELYKFFAKLFDPSNMTFEVDLETGNIVPTAETMQILSGLETKLNKSLNNFFNLPTRGENWKYSIVPAITTDAEGNQVVKTIEDGRPLFNFMLTSEQGNIFLGEVTKGAMQPVTQFNIIKNILLDEEGEVRKRRGGDDFVIWNVDFNEVANKDTNPRAKATVNDLYEDDVFELSKASLKYTVKGVTIESPFGIKGETRQRPATTTTNKSNATDTPLNSPTESDAVVTPGGAVVDSSTGTIISGTPVNNKTKQKPQNTEEGFDSDLGLVIGQDDTWDDDLGDTNPSEQSIYTPPKLQWGVFEGYILPNGQPINVAETIKNLEAAGITKLVWDSYSVEEKEHELKCKGV